MFKIPIKTESSVVGCDGARAPYPALRHLTDCPNKAIPQPPLHLVDPEHCPHLQQAGDIAS